MMEDAIYDGGIVHRRHVGRFHEFKYTMYLLWLNVADVDHPKKRWPFIWRSSWAPVSVLARDYMAHRKEASLTERLSAEIKEKLGTDWTGSAYLLAHPRHFGFVMNPLALYYCFNEARDLSYIVGEITNTPWGERHCYVFDMRQVASSQPVKFSFKKDFHVSPFLPMDMDYTWALTKPGERLTVNIWNHVGERLDFEAHMSLKRQSLSRASVLRQLLSKPFMTFKVLFGIYLNAGILYAIKRVRFYDHPKLSTGGPS